MGRVSSNREVARQISRLYGSDFLAHYVYWKVRTDPVYAEVARRLALSDRPLLDVGCGAGVLAFYLRRAGIEVPITGLDLDAGKIARARRVTEDQRIPDVSFETRLVEELDGIPGNVTLLDIVHYLEDETQHRLLRSIALRAEPGARILIRETLADGSWRARVTWLEEVFARATGWMRTSTINFPTLESLRLCFPEDEFDCEILPLWGRTPFNSYLIEFARRGHVTCLTK